MKQHKESSTKQPAGTKPRKTQQRKSSGRPRGRPAGMLLPAIVHTRISHYLDAQLTVLSEMTGESRTDIARLALVKHMAEMDLDNETLTQLLRKKASELHRNDDPDALRTLIADASRHLGIPSTEVCKLLRVPLKALRKQLYIAMDI